MCSSSEQKYLKLLLLMDKMRIFILKSVSNNPKVWSSVYFFLMFVVSGGSSWCSIDSYSYLFFSFWWYDCCGKGVQELYLKNCRSYLRPGVMSFSSKDNFHLLLPSPCVVWTIQSHVISCLVFKISGPLSDDVKLVYSLN